MDKSISAQARIAAQAKASPIAWKSLPARVRQLIIEQLGLFDAARLTLTSADFYARVLTDPRWTSLVPRSCFAAGPPYRQAILDIKQAICGTRTRAAVKSMLSSLPLRPLAEACADSDAYVIASLADWQQEEEACGNTQAVEAAEKIFEAQRTKASVLSLSRLPVRTLPNVLGQLTALCELEMVRCQDLTALPEGLGQLAKLQVLDLAGCRSLTALPTTVGQLAALRELDLYGCARLTALPDSFAQLAALQRLVLHGCRSLAALPESVGQLAALQELDLCGCQAFLSSRTELLLQSRECVVERLRCSCATFQPTARMAGAANL